MTGEVGMRRRGRVARLTKRVVDAAAPESSRYYVWDTELSGFALRVEPSGHRTFVGSYRAGGGRSGTLRQTVIGRYGNITVEEGRTAGKKLLGAAAGGSDPIGERYRARQSAPTVAQLCDWYLEQA